MRVINSYTGCMGEVGLFDVGIDSLHAPMYDR